MTTEKLLDDLQQVQLEKLKLRVRRTIGEPIKPKAKPPKRRVIASNVPRGVITRGTKILRKLTGSALREADEIFEKFVDSKRRLQGTNVMASNMQRTTAKK